MLLWLFGYVAFLLPLILGAVAGSRCSADADGDGEADLGPALRLVGMVGFLISATGLLHLRGVPAEHFGRCRRHPRYAGRQVAAEAVRRVGR